jgi:RNA polymerase sigma factor (sigma-70 family)
MLRFKDSDKKLVGKTLAGDSAAFNVLVNRHSSKVYALALAHTRNAVEAEDVSQEAFLKAYRSLHTLKSPARFIQWITSLTRNCAIDAIRRRTKGQAIEKELRHESEAIFPVPERAEMAAILHEELANLPEEAREALLLYYFSGKKVREVAQTLDTTPAAAAKRLQRARAQLGEKLIDRLGEDALKPEAAARRNSRIAGAITLTAPVWGRGEAVSAATLQTASTLASLVTPLSAKIGVAGLALVSLSVMIAGSMLPQRSDDYSTVSPQLLGTLADDLDSFGSATADRSDSAGEPLANGAELYDEDGGEPDPAIANESSAEIADAPDIVQFLNAYAGPAEPVNVARPASDEMPSLDKGGTVTGVITFSNAPPQLRPIAMTTNPACHKMHDGQPIQNEMLILGENKTMGNIIVKVIEGLPAKEWPIPADPFEVTQQGCVYAPHVFVVRANQTVRVLNPDGVLHNVNATPRQNRPFNRAMPAHVTEMEVRFTTAEDPFALKCNVHPWMTAYCEVIDHPFYDTTEEDGIYSIAGLEPGDYTIQAWHERLGKQTAMIIITAEGATTQNFSFAVPTRTN